MLSIMYQLLTIYCLQPGIEKVNKMQEANVQLNLVTVLAL